MAVWLFLNIAYLCRKLSPRLNIKVFKRRMKNMLTQTELAEGNL